MRKPIPRVSVGWRVLRKVMEPDRDGKLVEKIRPLSRVFHAKDAAIDFQRLAAGDSWVAEVVRTERKELGLA